MRLCVASFLDHPGPGSLCDLTWHIVSCSRHKPLVNLMRHRLASEASKKPGMVTSPSPRGKTQAFSGELGAEDMASLWSLEGSVVVGGDWGGGGGMGSLPWAAG